MTLLGTAPVDDAVLIQPSEPAEDERGWAEAGESRLSKVCAHEGRQEKPPGAQKMRQGNPDKDQAAGHKADEGFDLHIRKA